MNHFVRVEFNPVFLVGFNLVSQLGNEWKRENQFGLFRHRAPRSVEVWNTGGQKEWSTKGKVCSNISGLHVTIRKPAIGQIIKPGNIRVLADISGDSPFMPADIEVCLEFDLQKIRCILLSEIKSWPTISDVNTGTHVIGMYLQSACSKSVLVRAFPVSFYVQKGYNTPNQVGGESLNQLAVMFDTDKGPAGHGYTEQYDSLLRQFQMRYEPGGKQLRLLEIGVKSGGSILMWRKYFPRSHIVGFDITMRNSWRKLFGADSGVSIHQCDQANRTELQRALQASLSDIEGFDIVIDDGGHSMRQQQTSLGFLFPYVRPGGVYIIEDLHTSKLSYFEARQANPDSRMTTLQALHRFVEHDAMPSVPQSYFAPHEAAYLQNHIAEICIHQSKRRERLLAPGEKDRFKAGSLFAALQKSRVP